MPTKAVCVGVANAKLRAAPRTWRQQCSHVECTLHQISPYIGKLKSPIARFLVDRYSSPGDIVFDPFSGSGTIPLEAALGGRDVLALDVSPYATLLTRAKLRSPNSVEEAFTQAEKVLSEAANIPQPDLRSVPAWVREFFHPQTLKEAIKFAAVCRQPGREFLFACFLGILHHQRPGFLSYPSSHLVPYLRTKKFPPRKFPEMYEYREIKQRLFHKIGRAFKRFNPKILERSTRIYQNSIEKFNLQSSIGSIITSPPYMNALDYTRDNRLRLWFLNPNLCLNQTRPTEQREAFVRCIRRIAQLAETRIQLKGYCVFVVGEQVTRHAEVHPAQVLEEIMRQNCSLQLREIIIDRIPDVRRSRRNCQSTRREHIYVYQKF